MPQEVAQQQYMDVMKAWDGYGSTLFDVEVGIRKCHSFRQDCNSCVYVVQTRWKVST